METKFNIDDVLYVPATVTKVIKTADGKVSYGLDICDRDEVEVTLTEDEVKKLCLLDSVMTAERYAEEKRYVVYEIQLTVEEYEALCRLSAKFRITKEQALEWAINLLDRSIRQIDVR